MSPTARLDHLESKVAYRDCLVSHFGVHVSHAGINGIETADPKSGPWPTCGGMRDVLRVVITTVLDRGERP